MTTRITDLTAATTLTGNELVEVSQRSTTVTITATTISAAASDNSLNDSGSGFGSFTAGDRVEVTGFTDAANNTLVATIDTVAAGKLTFADTYGDAIVDEAAGDSVTITKWVSARTTAQDIGDLGGGGGGGGNVEKTYHSRATLSSAKTAANYTAGAVISWDAAATDTADMWDGANPTRFTIPASTTVSEMHIEFFVRAADYSTSTFADYLVGQLYKNGTLYREQDMTRRSDARAHTIFMSVEATSSDYFEIYLTAGNDTSITVGADSYATVTARYLEAL